MENKLIKFNDQKILELLENNNQVISYLKNTNKELISINEKITDKNNELEKQIEESNEINKTMLRAFETNEDKDMKEVAKILNYKGFGRNTIFGLLRDINVLMSNNEPYQSYVNRGYFRLIQVEKIDSFNKLRIFTKTLITQKGIDFIRRKLDELTNE